MWTKIKSLFEHKNVYVNGYKLDNEQRKVVLNDDKVCLVVAGAGSGKTMTMIGKIKYLIENKKIDPRKILVLSFTNYTTLSFRQSLNKNISSNIDVLTFHKLGMKILKMNNYKVKICSSTLLDEIIDDYLKNDLLKNKKEVYEFIYTYVINNNELVNGFEDYMNDEEIILGNFLYCNGIKYTFKPIKIMKDKLVYAFYLDDYDLYLKHEYLGNLLDEDIEENNYPDNFIVTNSFILTYDDIFKYLYDEFKCKQVKIDEQKYFAVATFFLLKGKKMENLKKLIENFINMLKASNLGIEKIDKIKKLVNKMPNLLERRKLLFTLSIIEKIYIRYEYILKKNQKIDFNDIINISSNLIKEGKVFLNYDYIIVDEFQDTSISRYNLIKEIINQTDANLLAVGDDFQSIYRFTGCDVTMFLNFSKYFPKAKVRYLKNTYRNSQELIKVAGNFIMKNKYQMKKNLKSHKHILKPIKIYFYQKEEEINNLFSYIKEKSIFVLGRNNNDIKILDSLKTSKKYQFMSIHKSKGLEEEGVILINLCDNILGFPSKCEDNILIKYLCSQIKVYPYDEERRLFYVALTRTKNNVYLFVPQKKPSIFVKEIFKDYKKYIEIIN